MIRLAAAVFLVTAAVNLQLPLYGAFADEAGLSSGQMSLLLQGYVAALLLVLFMAGGISDAVGRRPVVLLALICSTGATAMVALSPGAWLLAPARWLQGLGVGLVMGAATAWMARLRGPVIAARVAGLASTVGFGAGALFGAVLGWEVTHAVLLVLMVSVGTAVVMLEDERGAGGRWVRRPELVPGTLAAHLGIGVGWMVAGIVVAVLPGVLHARGAAFWGGAVLAVLLTGGAAGQVLARASSPEHSLRIGAVVLPIGVAMMAAGLQLSSTLLLCAGAFVAGLATHGWLYVGGLQRVGQCAPSSAGAVSAFFLSAYLGFGGPAVLMGAAVDAFGPAAFWGLAGAVVLGGLGILRAA